MTIFQLWLTLVLAIAPAFVCIAVQTVGSCHKVKESVAPPRGWSKQAPAPGDHSIQLRIGLPQPNFNVLEEHLYQVSDPYHQRYGQHLSKEEVEDLVAPSSQSIRLVDEWLLSHGLVEGDISRSPAKDWVSIIVPISLAEKMLETSYHVWKHLESGDSIIRTTSYSLPEHLHEHIDVVQPTTAFARFKPFKSTVHRFSPVLTGPPVELSVGGKSINPSCNSTITVSCLKQLYGAVGYKPSAKNGNQIGLTGYLGQNANLADLQLFFANQTPAALNSSFSVVSIKGGVNSQNVSETGIEANLDVQFAFGLTHPTPGVFYTTAGSPPFIADNNTPTNTNEPYLDWLSFVLKLHDLPQTISTSYGDDEQTVPVKFARRACREFAQLGARGVSLTFSSGDNGVGDNNPDPATQTCFTNDGRNVTKFIPIFPASCPFVTAVGGTTHINPEVAADFSGGGFSNYFDRPRYQKKAVDNYLDKLPKETYKGLFNRKGRGIPDVSAQARNYLIFFKGRPGLVDGTSASSPTFASIISFLNDARISRGLPPLGFLNPLLYTAGLSGLTDITSGNAPGCGTQGFNATEGWDPVTGLGTPNFATLLDKFT